MQKFCRVSKPCALCNQGHWQFLPSFLFSLFCKIIIIIITSQRNKQKKHACLACLVTLHTLTRIYSTSWKEKIIYYMYFFTLNYFFPTALKWLNRDPYLIKKVKTDIMTNPELIGKLLNQIVIILQYIWQISRLSDRLFLCLALAGLLLAECKEPSAISAAMGIF